MAWISPVMAWGVFFSPAVFAGLEGAVITGGQGEIVNPNLVLQHSSKLAVDAAGFGLKAGEHFSAIQNNFSDILLINVIGQNPSDIYGSMHAKGQIFITNPNGVLFGKGAEINVGGLVASTLRLGTDDFMAGRYVFRNSGAAGSVLNQGSLMAAPGGYVALLGPQVVNEGVVSAQLGSVLLGAADQVTLNFDNGSLVSYSLDQGTFNALMENRQLVQADGGQVWMTAQAADAVTAAVVNNSGVVRARTIQHQQGVIRLAGDTYVSSTGSLDASAEKGSGGKVEVAGGYVALGGEINASGRVNGGAVEVASEGNLSLAGSVAATGRDGHGGQVRYQAAGAVVESAGSVTDVSGADGGSIHVAGAAGVLSSGRYLAVGNNGTGGRIDMSGNHVNLFSAELLASGRTQGGLVRVGGDFQGGKLNPQAAAYDQFVTRWQDTADIQHAENVFINDSSRIDVSSSRGDGGTAIIWSDHVTTQLGEVDANGAKQGGAVEISSADTLRYVALGNIKGADTLLLDPKNIIIGDVSSVGSWVQAAVVGAAYSGSGDLAVSGLASYDFLGTSVALSADGRLMAVGSYGDDGAGNTAIDSGAVRLFSFTDDQFSGAALQATIGKGYVGGNNINVATLQANDYFGSSVAMNADGSRLVVGAVGDDGSGNGVLNAGAVYLFSATGSNFSGGYLHGVAGRGYNGSNDINVTGLDAGDSFGSAVAMNAAGDRLAVGAYSDDGAGNTTSGAGAVYLYSFANNNFGGAALESTIGKGYAGGKNLDVTNLEAADGFGIAASLNAAGDRLAVGAFGDDGAANLSSNSGAAYLFSFADSQFSGATQQFIVGKGYSGGKNVDLANLEAGDGFGRSVALNAAADRLAAGAYLDDGAGNLADSSGAVYMLGFADGSFTSPALQTIMGKGYTGTGHLDIAALQTGDYFGSALAFNASGDQLAVGAMLDDGAANAVQDSGAVHLFKRQLSLADVDHFADYQGKDVTIAAADLASILSAGTHVVLQANNDITVNTALQVANASGNGGDLQLQAGRNVTFNANIVTDNGNLTAVAGDTGAIAADRDAGVATMTIGSGVTLDAGSGQVTLVSMDGVFINQSGSANPIQASQWFVYSANPASNSLGGMTANKHYSQPYVAGSVPGYAATGNWLFYSVAPVLSVTPNPQVVGYGNSPAPFSATYSGFIDGDDVGTSGISGAATFTGGGAAPGTYNIDYVNGLLSSLGYVFANNAASAGELVVLPQATALENAIVDAQKPPLEQTSNKKPLSSGCGGEALIVSSAGAVFERFIDAEEDTCELDLIVDEDGEIKNKCPKKQPD